MTTEKQLNFYIEEEKRKIEKANQRIVEYQSDIERLKGSDVLCVGDRVRLKRSYNTTADLEQRPGWSSCLHFMIPSNPATIKTVECYKGKIGYTLEFDDQTCYYTHPSEKPTYRADGVFYFPASAIEPIDKSIWYDFKLTAIKKEYIELLDKLKESGIIKSYEIKEIK